jgi:hypothetical protein
MEDEVHQPEEQIGAHETDDHTQGGGVNDEENGF